MRREGLESKTPKIAVFGSCSVLRCLGSGGMGVVYEAWDARLERRVAIKLLHAHLTSDANYHARMLREARLAARVEHPNVVHIYNVHDQDGVLAIEMQYINGTPLQLLIQERSLTPEHAAELMAQVLDALDACHQQGVVHGDLKPANLMVTAEGRVLLTDFGIARAVLYGGPDSPQSLSLSGPLWGTPQYTPPEAWDGAAPDPRWDLYALGVLMHEALCGSLPFETMTPAVLMREKLDRPHRAVREGRPDLSPAFASLIDALKARDPAERPPSPSAALRALAQTPERRAEMVETQPFRHDPIPRPEHTPARAISHGPITLLPPASQAIGTRSHTPRYLSAGIVLAVLAIAALALALRLGAPPPPGTSPPPPSATIAAIGKPGEILDLLAVEDHAYFSYDDGIRGRELWCALPDGNAELVSDINPGTASSNPARFLPRGNGILFAAATNAHGEEPWYCSTSPDYHSVWMIRDIVPGPIGSAPRPLATLGMSMLFSAHTPAHGTELWLTTTLEAQTGMLRDIDGTDFDSLPRQPSTLADDKGLYFIATKDGWSLWRYEHEEGAMKQLGPADELTTDMALLNGTLFASMSDEEHGRELWCYREGMASPALFLDIWPGPDSAAPQHLAEWNGRLYFQASTPEHGAELWVTDGTPAGTSMLADIDTGKHGSAPYDFTPSPRHLFFRARNGRHGNELWRTDGTAEGTRITADTRPGAESSHPYNLVPLGPYLFFTADDGALGEELWTLPLDGLDAPPKLVQDLWPGPPSAQPHALQPTGPDTAILACKTEAGDILMKLQLNGDQITLHPYTGLRRPE